MKKGKIAILYDFDKTLITKDMQEFSFIPSLGISNEEFWNDVSTLAKEQNMDRIQAYLYTMIKKSNDIKRPITKNSLVSLGANIEYFPGVESWFDRINSYGKDNDVEIEHFVISSGLSEIIQGSSIYNHFKRVYGCEYLYDEKGFAIWVKSVINYTSKTQILFRINKDVLNLCEDERINEYVPPEERDIPFSNMIYIGDGLTDVPCMLLVREGGGVSVAVFKSSNDKTAKKLLLEKRVDYATEANYEKDSELDTIVKTAISKMASSSKLDLLHFNHIKKYKNGKDK